MQSIALQHSAWSLHGSTADLTTPQFTARIDTARPQLGLYEIASPQALAQSNILSVHRIRDGEPSDAANRADTGAWPLHVTESYIRGNDLVSCYEPEKDWPFAPQLYWRAGTLGNVPGVIGSVSLLVSVQTHLLDTCPQIGVSSQIPAGETILIAIGENGEHYIEPIETRQQFPAGNESLCIVRRHKGSARSYVEIMEPSDFRGVTVSPTAGHSSVEWQLFADFLEKGVIRRAPVHAAFLPRENDLELAAICCDAAGHLELPLTT